MDKPILNKAQFSDSISYHTIRREHAQKAYAFYERMTATPEGREKLRNQLIERWNANHSDAPKPDRHGNKRKSEKIVLTKDGWRAADPEGAAQRFLDDMTGTYVLRGDNRARAMAEGRPGSYDKLALMAVSVFCLAHWRNDVSVSHYML